MTDNKKIVVVGEILYDVFQNKGYESLGGAPFNFSFHVLKMLGDVSLISSVGKDKRGEKLKRFLKQQEFPLKFIQRNNQFPTGVVNVNLDENGIPTYEITKNVAYDNIEFNQDIENMLKEDIDVLYFGTLAQRNQVSRNSIREIIKESKSKIKFCDLNLREGNYTDEIIEYSLNNCNFLKVNEEELNYINKNEILGQEKLSIIRTLAEEYCIDNICLTMGAEGSILYSKGEFFIKVLSKEKVVNTVGAGDAFSAMMVMGMIMGKKPNEILRLASDFALRICMVEGAIPKEDHWYTSIREELAEVTDET